MDKLWEDAANLQCALPHVSQEELAAFLRRIPLRRAHERCALALLHFLTTKDAEAGDGLHRAVEEDALLIGLVLRDVDYHDVKQRLRVLGNIRDRREVVLRQLLHEKYGVTRKRKEDKSNDETTAIRIKIRKKDGSLEVTSTVTPSSTKQQQPPHIHHLPFEPTDSNIAMREMSPDSDSTPTSCRDSDSVNSTRPESDSTSTSRSVSPDLLAPSKVPSVPPLDLPQDDKVEKDNFDLLAYLKEVTVASEVRILSECRIMNLSLNKRPTDFALDELITRLLSNGSEVIELDSEDERILLEKDVRRRHRSERTENPVRKDHKIRTSHQQRLPTHIGSNNLKLTRPKRLKRRPSITITKGDIEGENIHNTVNIGDTMELEELPNSGPVLPVVQEVPGPSGLASKDIRINNPQKPASMMYRTGCKRIYESDEDSDATDPQPSSPTSLGETVFKLDNRDTDDDPLKEPFVPIESINEALKKFEEVARQVGITENPAQCNDSTAVCGESKQLEGAKEVQSQPVDLSKNEDKRGNQRSEDDNTTKLEENSKVEPWTVAGSSKSETKPKERLLCQKLVQKIMELFPEACPEFIRNMCDGKKWEEHEQVMNIFLEADYPKRIPKEASPERELDADEQYELLKGLLPEADPTFLRMQSEQFAGQPDGLKAWVEEVIETCSYPTMKEYLRKQKLSAQQKQYTTNFSVEKFVELFPNPIESFKNHKIKWDDQSVHYAYMYLRNRFDRLPVRTIQDAFKACDKDLSVATATLLKIKGSVEMKTRRKQTALPATMINIPLLQQIAYMTHEEKIIEYLENKKEAEEEERKHAKLAGLLEICGCCYDEDVMPQDIATCPKGCKFCMECIRRSAEVAFGQGKLDFPCLADCGEVFSLQMLQRALPPKMFSRVAQKKALQEVTAAGIEELETCPFCDFATIPAPGDRLFRCLNLDCMKESCRLCREPSHVPLRCDEVEKDADVKARVFVENKMTEALLRKCWKCGTKFFKEEGCNKMTCSCGAMMCYICSKPVKDYSHFNGIGGDHYHLCPLYSDNIKVNEENVVRAAEEAKRQVDPSKLKVDPTADLRKHYEERKRQMPREPHLQVLGAGMHVILPPRGVQMANHNYLRPRYHVPQRAHMNAPAAPAAGANAQNQAMAALARGYYDFLQELNQNNQEMHARPVNIPDDVQMEDLVPNPADDRI